MKQNVFPRLTRLSVCTFASFVCEVAIAQVPSISGIAPAAGPIGQQVTISGANFDANPANDVVRFGAVTATVLSAASGSLSVSVPLGATYSPVTVTAEGKTAYSDAPFVVTFPSSGSINTNSFAPQAVLATDSTPTGTYLADLDGDGKPDLIVANWGAASISVSRNISTNGLLTPGSFAPKVDFAVGTHPYFMAVGDLNGDGKLDLVVANSDSGTISIFPNISSPGSFTTASFAPRVNISIPGAGPYQVAIEDLDGDGFPDLVVTHGSGGNTISVLRNLGNASITSASFAEPVSFTAGVSPAWVAIGDLNGDGKPDLAVAGDGGTLSILQNTSTPGSISSSSFAAPVTWNIGGRLLCAVIGDLDGDGKPDIAVADDASSELSILHNLSGAGTLTSSSFATPFNLVAAGPSQNIALGDIAGDGRLDIVQASGVGVVSIFQNISATGVLTAGSFAPRVDFQAQNNTLSVVIGDLDGDGKPDIAAANDYSSTLSIYHNVQGAAVGPPVIAAQPQNTSAVADSSVTLSVSATGANPLSYQWFASPGGSLAGATNSSLTLSNVQTSQAGTYSVVVSNPSGSVTSAPAALTVFVAPVITNQPQSQTVVAGSNATFSVTATGSSLTYQWYQNGGTLFGQTNASLALQNVGLNQAGTYYVVVSSGPATTTSATATLTVLAPPVISTQPQSETAVAGNNASFNVGVSSPSVVTYQWEFDGAKLPAATGATLLLTNVQTAQAGSYVVIVSDSIGSVTSSIATLTVNRVGAPSIASFAPASGPIGGTVTIEGANFSPTPSNDVVYFGAEAAPVLSATAGALTVAVPASATYSPLTVTADGLTGYSTLPFDVTFAAGAFGAGSLAPQVDIATASTPTGLTLADMDGDGKPDLIVANWGAGSISVFRNISTNGSLTPGSFAPKVDFEVGDNPYFMAVGDLTGDGKLDLAVANSGSGTVSVFRNISTPGSFTADSFAPRVDLNVSGGGPYQVAIGDLDGDGLPDMVVAHGSSGNAVSVLRNLGAGSGSVSFAAQVDFPTGGPATWASIGDLNGDGKPDLAIANVNGTIAILQNTSSLGVINSGSFAAPVVWQVGGAPYCAVIGDLDGDGKPDIAIANYGNMLGSSNMSVSIFHNVSNTGGITTNSFAAPFGLAAASRSQNLALADLDGNGRVDIVEAAAGGVVSVFPNIGTNGTLDAGSFAPRLDFAAQDNTLSVVVGDLDGDGKPDVVAANDYSSTLSVYHNLLTTLSPVPAIVAQPQSENVVAGGSAAFSVSATGQSPLGYQWFFNSGTITNATNASLTLADVQASEAGSYSVIVGNPYGSATSSIAVLTIVNPSGVPTISSLAPQFGPTGATITVEGENFSSIPSNNIVYFGAEPGNVLSASPISLSVQVPVSATYWPLTVTVGGLTAASTLPFDLTFEAGALGTNSLAPQIDIGTDSTPTGTTLADLDGDGKPDLIVANYGAGSISVFRNISTNGSLTPGSFAPKVDFQVGDNPYFMAVGDLEGDGKLDLVVANSSSGTISIFRNTSTPGSFTADSFAPRVDLNVTGAGPYQVAIGDVDGDGLPDLVVTHGSGGGGASVLRNLGGGSGSVSFASQVDFPTGGPATWVSIGDLNGDGKPDLAIANVNGTMAVLQNTSSPGVINSSSFAAPVLWQVGGTPYCAVIGDLDGDGKPDIAVANLSGGTVSIFHNAGQTGAIGSSSFAPAVNLAGASGSQNLALADLNGNGRIDIVEAANNGVVSVFPNIGTNGTLNAGSFAPRLDFAAQDNTLSVVVGDLDGDGKPDVVAANDYSSTLSVYHNLLASSNSTPPPTVSTVVVGTSSETGVGVVTVPINLLALGSENGVAFSVDFNPANLAYVSASVGAGASNAALVVNSSHATNGQVGIEIVLPSAATFGAGAEQLLQLTFQAVPSTNALTTSIDFGDQPVTRGVSDASAHGLTANYIGGTVALAFSQWEGDVAPRTNGNGVVNIFDWVQEGRFVAGLDTVSNANEFQRADCAPRSTLGDGVINAADWVQVGRYAAGLDPLTLIGGPTGPLPAPESPRPDGQPDRTVSLVAMPQAAGSNPVAVQLAAQGGENALTFSVAFDPTAVSFDGAVLAGAMSGALLDVNTNMAASGKIGFALALPPGSAVTAGNQQLAVLNFISASYSNHVALAFGNSPVAQGLADTNATSLEANFENAALTIAGSPWPHLNLAPSSSGLTMSWPASATGFNVETASTINGPWTVIPGTPVLSGEALTLVIPPPGRTAYYRLHHQ